MNLDYPQFHFPGFVDDTDAELAVALGLTVDDAMAGIHAAGSRTAAVDSAASTITGAGAGAGAGAGGAAAAKAS